ncbi:hypothetical protein FQA39_LY03504 [Lamprigera yunnana]|nr:hypothetical protein FQA39_LY03504 [Lamprigera yunnana]
MYHTPKYLKELLVKRIPHHSNRSVSKYLDTDKSSKAIRQCFLNYFINDHNHNFVRSSPVVPFYDASVPFVNAGMNQFKGVLLGMQVPQHKIVANSQKCVRVGGKHNDLSLIGLDGYHHTFFEMLGNWSFGNYFKEEAIKLAWYLLTEKYKIPKETLYVTYFGGDPSLGLEADLETKHIWRNLGVLENKILPFGSKDNFWEMGPTGPCGHCTEIHIDRLGLTNRSKFVNKGLQDLTELWNIVFIQYNREDDGSIKLLPEKHVDTGMGLERLTAVLQGKFSNYDTDLFTIIFRGIEKASIPKYDGKFGESDWNQLDTSYRILADHARMVTVCLGDGVIPDQNQKLRRIIRKAFFLSEDTFEKENGLLKELSNYVVESLGSIYPELEKNIQQIHEIILYEENAYKTLRSTSAKEWSKIASKDQKLYNLDVIEMPGLPAAYKELASLKTINVSPQLSFKLYDTYGLDEETITKLCEVLNLKFKVQEFREELENAKMRSREQIPMRINNKTLDLLQKENVNKTEDYYKYKYEKKNGSYDFPILPVKLLKVINDDEFVTNLTSNVNCAILLDKCNLYTVAGGQVSDPGLVKFDEGVFNISDSTNISGYILHYGALQSPTSCHIPINSFGEMEVNKDFRLDCMRNHTATHLLNSVLKNIKKVTCQKSSKVTPKYLSFDVGIFNNKLTPEDVENIEDKINSIIQNAIEVVTHEIDSSQLLQMDNVICVPGEVYPSTGIRVVEISSNDINSREPCCGTHVLNTSDIGDFCFIGLQSLGRSTTSLHAVTGACAEIARKNGDKVLKNVSKWVTKVESKGLKTALINIKEDLNYSMDGDKILPLTVKYKCMKILSIIESKLKDKRDGSIETEIKLALEEINKKSEEERKFIVHYLQCSKDMTEHIPLHKATKLCSKVPVLVISYSDKIVRARCCVPKEMKTDNFDAEKWLGNTIGTVFNSAPLKMKNQDCSLACNMKGKKIENDSWDTLLKKSIRAAESYAKQHLK